jgi:hypothetical protein
LSDGEIALAPQVPCTTTSTAPEPGEGNGDGGEVTVIDVSDVGEADAVAVPKNTASVPQVEKPVPVIVTLVPPVDGPVLGETPATVGAAANAGRESCPSAPAAMPRPAVSASSASATLRI